MKGSKLAILSFVLPLIPFALYIINFLSRLLFFDLIVSINALAFFSIFDDLRTAFFLYIPLSILSIILGIISLVKIKSKNLSGRGYAISGITLSVIVWILTAGALLLLMNAS